MLTLPNGVCAPLGFSAAGIFSGIKENSNPDKHDLALILSEKECAAAATYTLNRVKAAPIYLTMKHLETASAWGIVANSKNANACCENGAENALRMAQAAAKETGHLASDFIVASTGVIGQELNISAIERGMPVLAAKLSPAGSHDAATAIMTTDLKSKELAISIEVGGKTVTLGAIAKGSGMIHPNMGTMLCFITTDCAIANDMLCAALDEVVKKTFNCISVDGDTSTNDMCAILANGMAGNELIEWQDTNYLLFKNALSYLCTALAKEIAADGEGATKLVTCTVQGARSEENAQRMAKSVIASSLVKTAMFGADANWGRVLCAMGYSKAPFRPEYVDISFANEQGVILVCANGDGINFDEAVAKDILSQSQVEILIDLHEGDCTSTCWGCDLTYDYVKINGDYRT